mmetsp:Transcript_35455/g.79561  ORF Transcript_35455/g.79561 Transcript_35455/m.79561 type:complete len:404 (+) Transcript_35455:276-1487(+)
MMLGVCRASAPAGARAADQAAALLRPAGRFRGRTDPIRGGGTTGVRRSSTAEGGAARRRGGGGARPGGPARRYADSANPTGHPQRRPDGHRTPGGRGRPILGGHMVDESALLSGLAPSRRILCVVPVPLGRGRVSWTGGDPVLPDDDRTLHLDFGRRGAEHEAGMRGQPFRVRRFRYGERYEVGLAVTDPGLTAAYPVSPEGPGGGETPGGGFAAELVPSFCGDAHGLPSSRPVFRTDLPPTADDLLDRIGCRDVGAVVLAMPLGAGTGGHTSATRRGGLGGGPTKMQLEAERNLDAVGGCLAGVLGNYVGAPGRPAAGPLDLQCRTGRRLSLPDALSRCDVPGTRWSDLAGPLRRLAGSPAGASGPWSTGGTGGACAPRGVPAGVHAAAALSALLDGLEGRG